LAECHGIRVLLSKLPDDATQIAGAMGKLQAWTSRPIRSDATLLSGLLGGLFLQLSYSDDQSQVHVTSARALREGRLGLMFNAMFKIPMQFCIVMLGAMLFVFYQFQPNTPSSSSN